MKEISLTRALVELKTYDDRIKKAIQKLVPTAKVVNGIVIGSTLTEKEFLKEYESNFQSLVDLRKNKEVLKKALMEANATTKVKIADKEYTILEAKKKKSDIAYDNILYNQLATIYNQSVKLVDTHNETIENRIQEAINSTAGSSANKSKEYIENIKEQYKKDFAVCLNKDETVVAINKIVSDKDEFLKEVDFALSEINAITKIKIENL